MLRAGEMIFLSDMFWTLFSQYILPCSKFFFLMCFFFIPDLLFYLDWKDIWIPSQFFFEVPSIQLFKCVLFIFSSTCFFVRMCK